jgi:type I restriction enzyme, S subunit
LYLTEYSQTYNEKGLAQSKLWEAGTLCVTIAANIAETEILGISACFPDSIIGFVPDKKKSDVKFIKYCLDTYKLQMQSISQGTTQDNMSLEKLLSIDFIFPDLVTQKKIAAILSAYDDLIENNKRRIALLEKMAEEIYREWFVRMRFPGCDRDTFAKSVAEPFTEKRFDDFCQLKRGYDLPDSQIVEGIYPILASTSIKAYHNEYKVKPPVITTGRSGSIGTVLFSNECCWPLNTALYVKDFKGNSVYYIYYTLRMMNLENFNSGAGVPSLNRNHLSALKLKIPNIELQRKFDIQIKPIFSQIETLQKLSQSLSKTRDMLLGRVISGKLSVENLDIQFPPSMTNDYDFAGSSRDA